MTSSNFSELPLQPAMLSNLHELNYATMTPVQQQSLPVILEQKDLIAQAKTGSGKTAAFGIGLLHHLDVNQFKTQALVICPTRELSDQVCAELRRLARAIPNTKITPLCGGKPMGGQLASLERAPHIVVGTPGRLLKHLEKGTLKLTNLTTLVLDEADRMLDMGFIDDIKTIIGFTPQNRQTLLFSATYPNEIKSISEQFQNKPTQITIESNHQHSDISQIFYEVEPDQRAKVLLSVLNHYKPENCVVFCNRKQQCDDIASMMSKYGLSVKALHGDLDQNDRDRVLTQFTNGSCRVLVATDVAARGLDIKELSMVVNYELSHDAEVHVHRVGRTGRAGAQGLAISLFQTSEMPKIITIENEYEQSATFGNVDDLNTTSAGTHQERQPKMVTIEINGGRKDKLRPGDIVGALTSNKRLSGSEIGNIDRFERLTYVAVNANKAQEA
ncbi:MAG: ATP-dependent RNA helicase DbpA, partial [Gammaproteobacteria bacterium]|nr:ATP-dependent RNA helicase DbpA [Gammaproteobacteria bacterium]